MPAPVDTGHDADQGVQSDRMMVGFTFDGRAFRGQAGQPVAIALLVAGERALRPATARGEMRGAFCLMGVCQECTVVVAGRRVEACRELVREGLVVELAR